MPTIVRQPPTFSIVAAGVATANNKSMFSILNNTGNNTIIRIHEIWIQNAQTSAVAGVLTNLELRRITGHSSGTDLSIGRHDTDESPNLNITSKTNATVSGEAATLLDKWIMSSDEWAPGTLDMEGMAMIMGLHFPVWRVDEKVKPLTLRGGEGITIKCATNTTTGLFDITVVFTQESAV